MDAGHGACEVRKTLHEISHVKGISIQLSDQCTIKLATKGVPENVS